MASAIVAPAGGRLVFEAARHLYWLDGRLVPSVTGILKSTGIIDYSMIPQNVLQAAARRGTAVHVALEYLDKGTLEPKSVDPELLGYLQAYDRFVLESGFEVAHVENRVFDAIHQYAGTLDRTGFIGDTLVILDFKTGLVLPGHALQISAYANCLPLPRRFRRIALKLNNDGTYRVHEFPLHEYRRDLDVFLAALSCQQYKLAKGIR